MPSPVTVLLKRPGEPTEVVTVSGSLKQYQALVGGLIELLPGEPCGLPEDIDIFCNENGKNVGLEANIDLRWDVICGPAYFVSSNSRGNAISLNDTQIATVRRWLETREI